MNSSESTKIVYSRIQKLEPELASKIVGFLLLQDNDNREMIRLALSPDYVILSITNKVKTELGLITSNQLQPTNSYSNFLLSPRNHNMNFPQDYNRLSTKIQLLSLDNEINCTSNRCYNERLPDFPSKICNYYTKGFCKHGSSCRFLHENLNDGFNEDHMLEMELTEILRSRNGVPVSISLLPLLYYEKYGKTLFSGLALTKLLAKMRSKISLVQRAHGQHSVILDEDLQKYMEYENEQTVPIAARQIYLTFPAESTFTEQEVCNHFNGYGPVEDVRLPFQQKRMFGFVTFAFPETVRIILAKGNPHFIYGSRVLVKPYKDKPRFTDRRNAERKHPIHFGLQSSDGESNTQPLFRTFNDTRHVKKNVMEEYEEELEIERKRLSGFKLLPTRMSNDHAYDKQADFQDQQRFSFLFDNFKDGSTREERGRCMIRAHNNHDSSQGPLPDSLFANSIARSLSTVM